MSGAYDVAARNTRELLADYAAVLRELRRRAVIRTNNAPVGDLAELLVAAALAGERGSFSQAGWDVRLPATDAFPEGERVQVKGLRNATGSRRTALSPIRGDGYDSVIVVAFDEDVRLTGAWRFTRAVVERCFRPRARDGARVIRFTARFRAEPDVAPLELSDALLDTPGTP